MCCCFIIFCTAYCTLELAAALLLLSKVVAMDCARRSGVVSGWQWLHKVHVFVLSGANLHVSCEWDAKQC
jgi:hypothetical protein